MAVQGLIATLTAERERQGLTQTHVAAKMGTKQSTLSKLEARQDIEAKLSYLIRYARSLGYSITWELKKLDG